MTRFPLYVLRHGQTIWNVEGRMQGQQDSALTALGRVQAARQGAILRALGGAERVHCSPLGRARHSAALAGLSAQPDPRLAEIGMGAWEGRLRSDLTDAPGVMWKFEAPGGEGLAPVLSRIDALLSDLNAPVILVTHGVLSILFRARYLGLPEEEWDRLDDPQGAVHVLQDGHETVLWRAP